MTYNVHVRYCESLYHIMYMISVNGASGANLANSGLRSMVLVFASQEGLGASCMYNVTCTPICPFRRRRPGPVPFNPKAVHGGNIQRPCIGGSRVW